HAGGDAIDVRNRVAAKPHRVGCAELLLFLSVGKGSRRHQAESENRRGHEFAAAENRTGGCHGSPLEVCVPRCVARRLSLHTKIGGSGFRIFSWKERNCFVGGKICFIVLLRRHSGAARKSRTRNLEILWGARGAP